jgi:hypothetical protein
VARMAGGRVCKWKEAGFRRSTAEDSMAQNIYIYIADSTDYVH